MTSPDDKKLKWREQHPRTLANSFHDAFAGLYAAEVDLLDALAAIGRAVKWCRSQEDGPCYSSCRRIAPKRAVLAVNGEGR